MNKQYETFGYALAMRVLQSDIYKQLDDRERAECDELIRRGQQSEQNAEGRVCKLSCTENCGSCVAPSTPERDAPALPFAILEEEMSALRRFHETAGDEGTYDVPKPMMSRLADIGLLRHISSGIYEETTFGMSVLNGDFSAALSPAGVVVPDKGPWTVAPDGHAIYSDDFDHDVHLSVHGDFADDTERKKYSDGIAALLTAAAKETK